MRFVADSSTELSPLSDDEGQSELELELNCQRESDQDFFDTESRWQRNFAIAVLYLTLASLEAFGGWRAGSLAVLSEAAYILGDCARFLMITFAMVSFSVLNSLFMSSRLMSWLCEYFISDYRDEDLHIN